MRRHLFVAGLVAAALLPSAVFAQQTCEQRSQNRTAGTLVGAGLGALLGGAIAGRDDRTAGVVIGGVGGAVAGNQIAGRGDCSRAYGDYDNNGQWHANGVQANNATGYYDTDGRWVGGAASGHYDPDGRWNATPSVGRYDADGRWVQGQAEGHQDRNGVWVADAQPGYYENGRWRRGEAHGYYDNRGAWIATAPFAVQQGAETSATYRGNGYGHANWNGAGGDFSSRRTSLETGIRRGMNNGTLDRGNGWQALRQLAALGRQERSLPHYNGMLARGDAQRMQARLDGVASNLRWSAGQDQTRHD